MTETVHTIDLGVVWEPGAPEAVLFTEDNGSAVLAIRAHHGDPDQRVVVLMWPHARYSLLAPPNDETINGHRLWGKGLQEVEWVGEVTNSELIQMLEKQNSVHPRHNAASFETLRHFVIPLKECLVEVVSRSSIKVTRFDGTTRQAAFASQT